MKYMKVKERYGIMDLQIFAGEGGEGSGEGDDQEDESDEEEDSDENGEDEKRFSQKDVDAAVEKRLARERRKWNRQQEKKKDGDDAGKDGDKESEETKARKKAENRASKAEEKLACFEAGVAKDSIDDVAALARSYMASNEELDLEDAIEKVLKKYPHFKNTAKETDEEEGNKGKSWGERQSRKSTRKLSGVEERFYEMNPDLKE